MNFNRKLFYSIFNFTNNNKTAKALGIFIAEYSQKFFIAIYVIGIFLVYTSNFNSVIKFVVIPFITLLYNSFLRYKLNMPRPFVKEGITSLTDHEASGSCPSNHGASAMIIAIAYFAVNPYIAAALIVLAVITGISRIMVGVHYPFDIVLSWIIALVIGSIGFIVF